MSVPTIRDLCERATKGPWRVRKNTSMAVEAISGRGVAATGGHSDNTRDPDDLARELSANAELIARLSPEVVLAAVEALETAKVQMEYEGAIMSAAGFRTDSIRFAIEKATHALTLLNGNAQPEARA